MIQRNKKLYINSIMLLIIAVTILIVGCGRKPPEAFWTWTSEDSTAVQNIVNDWRSLLTTTFEDGYYPITGRADTLRTALIEDMNNLWMRPHYWPGMITRVVDSSNYTMRDSFIPTKDTTIMVRVIERFSGYMSIIADSATMRLSDTIVGADTYDLYTRYFVAAHDTFNNQFTGTCEKFLHFEKDTTTNEWQLKKITGGAELFMPSQNDAPFIGRCTLRTTTKSVAVQQRPDTTQYGIQRLYPLDSIVSFSVNDTIATWLYYPANPVSFGFVHYGGKRYDLQLPAATRRYFPLTTGWSNLMLELVHWEALCKKGNYNATLWILPMQINP